MAEPDPEFDPPTCRCDGHGWVSVQPSYAAHLFPDPAPEVLAALPEDQANELWWQVDQRRAAALNTVYPCRVHKADLFFRWAGKHFAKDHDPGGCAECMEARTGPRVRRMSHAGGGRIAGRKDVDE